MNDGTTLARVKALIGDHAGLPADEIGDDLAIGEPVLIDGTPVGLNLDSLDRLELIVAFSEHFGIDIPDADADKPEMGTAAGIARYLDERIAQGQNALTNAADLRTHSEHSAINDEPAEPLTRTVEVVWDDPWNPPAALVTAFLRQRFDKEPALRLRVNEEDDLYTDLRPGVRVRVSGSRVEVLE